MPITKKSALLLTIFISLLAIDMPVLKLLKPLWEQTVFGVQHKPLVVNPYYAFIVYIIMAYGLYIYVYKNINADANHHGRAKCARCPSADLLEQKAAKDWSNNAR